MPDSDAGDWIDFTSCSSAYQQQVNNVSGAWRHRRRNPASAGMMKLINDAAVDGVVIEVPWRSGRAPDDLAQVA